MDPLGLGGLRRIRGLCRELGHVRRDGEGLGGSVAFRRAYMHPIPLSKCKALYSYFLVRKGAYLDLWRKGGASVDR